MFNNLGTPTRPVNQRIFFDTEFYEIGGIVRLISIGLVTEYGKELYAIAPNIEELRQIASDDSDKWVSENVLTDEALFTHKPVVPESLADLATLVTDFCGESPIFWAYISAYDAIVLRSCIFGRMIDAPKDWPYSTNDLSVPLALSGLKSSRDFPPLQEHGELPEHSAIADARWNKRVWEELLSDATANKFEKSQSIIDTLLVKPR